MLEEPKLKKKKHFSKKYLFFSIITLFMFGGISYGLIFFYQEYQGSSMGMTTDILTVEITEDGYVGIDSATGQKDKDGMNNPETQFTITNNSPTPVKIKVSLVEDATSTLDSNQVRFYFNGNNVIIGNLGENNNVLGEVYLGSGEDVYLYSTIWLDYYYTGSGEKFSAKYKVEVENTYEYANTYLTSLVGKNKGLYAINQDGTLNDGTNTENIKEYRYSGKNPDNYLKFKDELWRIIGVDNNGIIKIVKEEPVDTLAFGINNSFNYEEGNTLRNYLDYYSNDLFDNEYSSCGQAYRGSINLTDTYESLILNGDFNSTSTIFLIDAWDYLYSTDPTYYTSPLNDSNVINNTWLTGTYYTMTPITDTTTNVLAIVDGVPTSVLSTESYPIKPRVYLNWDVLITNGNGTKEKPYEIEFNELTANVFGCR